MYRRGARYVVRYRDPLGHQRQESAGTTLAAARALLAEHRADVHRGEYRAASRLTFAQYLPMWIRTYAGRTRSGLTRESRRNYAQALGVTLDGEPILRDGRPIEAVGYFGRLRMASIEPRHVRDYMATLAASGLSANSVRLKLAALKVLFATAAQDGLIRYNPALGVRVPVRHEADQEQHSKALTDAEYAALLAEVPEQHRELVRFLRETGVRISELAALRWSDCDLDAEPPRVRISRRIYRGHEGRPKSAFGVRSIPLSAHVAADLRARRGTPAGHVFPSSTGGPLQPSNAFRWLKPAARRAGVPWAGFHTLRHSAATELIRAGWSAVDAQRFLGHHDPGFTARVYVHTSSDELPAPPWSDVAIPEGVTKVSPRPTEMGRDATAS